MTVITRDVWGAEPPKTAPTRLDPKSINTTYVHHGASPVTHGIAAGEQAVRSYQSFHMHTNGWNDIAYNWLVDQDGVIYEGRGWLIQSAATLNNNSTSQALCWIGNDEIPSDAALNSINQLISEAEHYAGHALAVKPHRAAPGNSTSCPGDRLTAWIAAGRPVGTGALPPPTPNVPPASSAPPPVRWVQERLYVHSVNDPALAVSLDGQDGPKTQAAIKKFQQDAGLVVDGQVGPLTTAALATGPAYVPGSAPVAPPKALEPFPGTMAHGATGEGVQDVQEALARHGYQVGPADGVFGSRTEAAVRGFQTANGLVSDGIVGPASWHVLVS
jgi:peptidoglycan hydrolase-like protein with peptidoglycan-binding domain